MEKEATIQVQSKARRHYLNQLPPPILLREVIKAREVFVRQEMIPLGGIALGGMIIDENHASELGDLMVGKWGQTQAIAVRCRVGGNTINDVHYDILDGFHRVAGLLARDGKEIKAEVYYNCNDEEMYDQRIVAANSVKSVKFARMAFWMNGAWAQTPWRKQLSVAQAFGLTNSSSSGKILGINEEEVEKIKQWCTTKAKRWLSEVGTIYQDLRLVEEANKDLLMRVRSGSFVSGGLALTRSQFEVIVKAFPKSNSSSRNEQIQARIAELANSQSLSTPQLESFVAELKQQPAINQDTVTEVFRDGAWRQTLIIATNGETRTQGYTLSQVIGGLHRLRKRITYSQEIPDQLRNSLLTQIDEMEKSLPKSGLVHSQMQAKEFLSHWQDNSIAPMLRTNNSYQEKFQSEVLSLPIETISEIANICARQLLDSDINKRDHVIDILKRLPLRDLDQQKSNQLLQIFISQIDSLQKNSAEQTVISPILESMIEALEEIKELRDTSPNIWNKILHSIENLALKADPLCKQMVFGWMKEFTPL